LVAFVAQAGLGVARAVIKRDLTVVSGTMNSLIGNRMAFFPFVLSGQRASGVENDIDFASCFTMPSMYWLTAAASVNCSCVRKPPSAVIPFATASTLDLVFEC
jgi:hypothetical protein